MTTHETKIRYRGRSRVDPSNEQRLQEIVNALASAQIDDSVDFDGGSVRGLEDEIYFDFAIEVSTTLSDAQTEIDDLAGKLVELKIEPDLETAKEKIKV